MTPELRYVDPTRRPGLLRRVFAAFAGMRVSTAFSKRVNWKLDRALLRVTRGRLASTLMVRSALLETKGARSGARRRNSVIYFHDGESVIIVASHAGRPRHPAWFHNLCADPNVTLNGITMRASVVEDEAERERLWACADRVFPAFARYRRDAAKADRVIPIVRLIPLNAEHSSPVGRVNRGEPRQLRPTR